MPGNSAYTVYSDQRTQKGEQMNKKSDLSGLGSGDCWIAPDGTVHRVGFCQHERFAFSIGETVESLKKKAWLHIGSNYISMRYNDLSDAQRKSLFDVFGRATGQVKTTIERWLNS